MIKSRSSERTRYAVQHSSLIAQLIDRGIQQEEVIQAMRTVPRHLFLASSFQDSAYEDIPLPIGCNQTISQPYVVALMCELLLRNSFARDNVLEIGTGCGYQTALLAQLYKRVVSFERIGRLVNATRKRLASFKITNVELHHDNGFDGIRSNEKFCAIVLSAAPTVVHKSLVAMLQPKGCLIAPVGPENDQQLKLITRNNGVFMEESHGSVRFVPLVQGVVA